MGRVRGEMPRAAHAGESRRRLLRFVRELRTSSALKLSSVSDLIFKKEPVISLFQACGASAGGFCFCQQQ